MNQQERFNNVLARLQKIYPNATIDTTIDDSGNIVWETDIPGVKKIQSMNIQAIETFVSSLEQKKRAKLYGL